MEIPNNPDYGEVYENKTEGIKEAVGGLVSCTVGCPSFNVTVEPTVDPTELKTGFCRTHLGDAGLADLYEAVEVDEGLTCVTACNPRHTSSKTCYNKGVCRVFEATGPLCECVDPSSTWYLGSDCSLPIKTTTFYAGLSVTLAALGALIGVLMAFTLKNKRTQKKKKDLKEKLVNECLNEDFEWPESKLYSTEVYKNPTFPRDEAAVHGEEPGVYRRPPPAYQPTRPYPQTDYRPTRPSPQTDYRPTWPSPQTDYRPTRPSPQTGYRPTRPSPQTGYRPTWPSPQTGYRQSASPFYSSQPANRHNTQSYNAGYSPSAGRPQRVSANQPMRINRPDINLSWDA
ncbi:mucin-17-like [Notolabrus celidotus]|uniref:mucin-17-like n=1 Tax=Notolabrus celidotus TaxID=1203425 RepID=UPI00148F596C|nr:mucin-17-like [Notolabrus celidotus]